MRAFVLLGLGTEVSYASDAVVVFINERMHKGVNRITQILYRRVFYHVRAGFTRPWSKIMIQIYVIESFALDSLYIRLFRFLEHMLADNMSVE